MQEPLQNLKANYWIGFQPFYLWKIGKGIMWILTGGVFGIGLLLDLFTLGSAVDNYTINQNYKKLGQQL